MKEVLDNTINEYIMGQGKEVQLAVEGNRVKVRDFGRGIPLGKVVDCVSQINTGENTTRTCFTSVLLRVLGPSFSELQTMRILRRV